MPQADFHIKMYFCTLQIEIKKYSIIKKKSVMKRTKIKEILQKGKANETVVAKGWVRTKRGSKNVLYVIKNII